MEVVLAFFSGMICLYSYEYLLNTSAAAYR